MRISRILPKLRLIDVARKAHREDKILKWKRRNGVVIEELNMNLAEQELACNDDWGAAQAHDEALEKRAVTEAYERIYIAINRLEMLDNCSYSTLRADVRLTEIVLFRK